MVTSYKRIFGLVLAIGASFVGLFEVSKTWPAIQAWQAKLSGDSILENDATAFLRFSDKEQNVTLIFQIPHADANLFFTETTRDHDLAPIAIMIQQKTPNDGVDLAKDKLDSSPGI